MREIGLVAETEAEAAITLQVAFYICLPFVTVGNTEQTVSILENWNDDNICGARWRQ